MVRLVVKQPGLAVYSKQPVSFNLRLTAALHVRLQAQKDLTGRSINALVVEAIEQWLSLAEQEGQPGINGAALAPENLKVLIRAVISELEAANQGAGGVFER